MTLKLLKPPFLVDVAETAFLLPLCAGPLRLSIGLQSAHDDDIFPKEQKLDKLMRSMIESKAQVSALTSFVCRPIFVYH
jgi:hypothetical protein